MPRTTSRIRPCRGRFFLACLTWSTSASGPPSCTARAQGLHRQFLREEGRACMKVGGRYAEDHVAHPHVRVEDASSLRASHAGLPVRPGPPSCTAPRAGLAPPVLARGGSCLHEGGRSTCRGPRRASVCPCRGRFFLACLATLVYQCVRTALLHGARAGLAPPVLARGGSTSASGPPSCTAPRAGLAPASPCVRRVVLA